MTKILTLFLSASSSGQKMLKFPVLHFSKNDIKDWRNNFKRCFLYIMLQIENRRLTWNASSKVWTNSYHCQKKKIPLASFHIFLFQCTSKVLIVTVPVNSSILRLALWAITQSTRREEETKRLSQGSLSGM